MPKSRELSLEEIEIRNKPFYLIDKQEILSGMRLSSKNAKNLFDSATLVKKTIGNAGIANSLLILAAEESIKAFVLVAVLINIPLPFVIDYIFSKHTVKHARGREINQVIEFIFVVMKVIPLKKNKVNNSFKDVIQSILSISNKEEWWEAANLNKNKGLYVDYFNGHFTTPMGFSKDHYAASEKVVSQYVTMMEVIADSKPEEFYPLIELTKNRSI